MIYFRLERPSHCHPDLYKIISKCWAGDMNKRPDFTELRLVSLFTLLTVYFLKYQVKAAAFSTVIQIIILEEF